MPISYIDQLIETFKIIALLGFIATGGLIIGISYKLFKNYFKETAEKKKWVFYILAIVISIILIFIYQMLF